MSQKSITSFFSPKSSGKKEPLEKTGNAVASSPLSKGSGVSSGEDSPIRMFSKKRHRIKSDSESSDDVDNTKSKSGKRKVTNPDIKSLAKMSPEKEKGAASSMNGIKVEVKEEVTADTQTEKCKVEIKEELLEPKVVIKQEPNVKVEESEGEKPGDKQDVKVDGKTTNDKKTVECGIPVHSFFNSGRVPWQEHN